MPPCRCCCQRSCVLCTVLLTVLDTSAASLLAWLVAAWPKLSKLDHPEETEEDTAAAAASAFFLAAAAAASACAFAAVAASPAAWAAASACALAAAAADSARAAAADAAALTCSDICSPTPGSCAGGAFSDADGPVSSDGFGLIPGISSTNTSSPEPMAVSGAFRFTTTDPSSFSFFRARPTASAVDASQEDVPLSLVSAAAAWEASACRRRPYTV